MQLTAGSSAQGKAPIRRDQGGFTLTEVLVSIILIGMVAGALTAMVVTALRTSAEGNAEARASVLVTSFEETLLQLHYAECDSVGDLAAYYNGAFEAYEANLANPDRRIEVADHIVAEVVGAESGCSVPGGVDTGEQKLFVELTYDGHTTSGNVVKRDLDPPDKLLDAAFEVTILTGSGAPSGPFVPGTDPQPYNSTGALKGIFALDATPSFSPNGFLQYSWDCDTSDPNNAPIVKSGDDPTAECAYNAEDTTKTYSVELTITSNTGATAVSGPVALEVGAAAQPIADPEARIVKVECPSAGCNGGDAPLTVKFYGEGVVPGNRTIAEYEWNFGDGVTSNVQNPTHVYNPVSDATYLVELTVTDNTGRDDDTPDTHTLVINVPGPPKPTAAFTMSPGPTVAEPQQVVFDAGASVDHGGAHANLEYIWDFDGNNVTTSNDTISRTFDIPGEKTITLTVRDLDNGATHFVTKVLTVTELSPVNNSDLDFRFLYATAGYRTGDFYFQWTNPVATPGDYFEYDIQLSNGGLCSLAFGTHERTVRSTAQGSPQVYDFHIDAGYTFGFIPNFAGVCSGQDYTYQLLELRRYDAGGNLVHTYNGSFAPVTVEI